MNTDHEFEVCATAVALGVAVGREEVPALGALHLSPEARLVKDCDLPHIAVRVAHSVFTLLM